MFYPNAPGESIRKDTNLLKKLRKGDADWTYWKWVLWWILEILYLTFLIPTLHMHKVHLTLS